MPTVAVAEAAATSAVAPSARRASVVAVLAAVKPRVVSPVKPTPGEAVEAPEVIRPSLLVVATGDPVS